MFIRITEKQLKYEIKNSKYISNQGDISLSHILIDIRDEISYLKKHILNSININVKGDNSTEGDKDKMDILNKYIFSDSEYYTFTIIDSSRIENIEDQRINDIKRILNVEESINDLLVNSATIGNNRWKNFLADKKDTLQIFHRKWRPIYYVYDSNIDSLMEDIDKEFVIDNTCLLSPIKTNKLDVTNAGSIFNPIHIRDNIWLGDNIGTYDTDYLFPFDPSKIKIHQKIVLTNMSIKTPIVDNNNSQYYKILLNNISIFGSIVQEKMELFQKDITCEKEHIIYLYFDILKQESELLLKSTVSIVSIGYIMIYKLMDLQRAFSYIYPININFDIHPHFMGLLFEFEIQVKQNRLSTILSDIHSKFSGDIVVSADDNTIEEINHSMKCIPLKKYYNCSLDPLAWYYFYVYNSFLTEGHVCNIIKSYRRNHERLNLAKTEGNCCCM